MKTLIITAALLAANPAQAMDWKYCHAVSSHVVVTYTAWLNDPGAAESHLKASLSSQYVKSRYGLSDMIKHYHGMVFTDKLIRESNPVEIVKRLGIPLYNQCLDELPEWEIYFKRKI